MIRVNLLKDSRDRGTSTVLGGGTFLGGSDSVEGGESARPDLLIKIVMFIVPVIFLYGYQQYTAGIAEAQMEVLKQQSDQIDTQLKALDPVVKELERFEEEKRKLNSQLDIIKRLSKERLKNVKSLDALQGIIPAKAWLSQLKIVENKVELEGFATDDIVISDFMQSLDSSIYFTNISLTTSDEAKKEDGVVKKFIIKCNLENL
ncbi:MAG: PilN domain-containing protein [Oligoflexia bacterium]|nr:PilN domain-containing protein [Oligoflexia bacterium]